MIEADEPVVAGDEKVSIDQSNIAIHELISLHLRQYMIISLVAGLCLAVSVGVVAWKTVSEIELVKTQAVTVADQARAIAQQRTGGCAYTKKFEGIIKRWIVRFKAAAPNGTPASRAARIRAFNLVIADLDNLGQRSCATAKAAEPTVPL